MHAREAAKDVLGSNAAPTTRDLIKCRKWGDLTARACRETVSPLSHVCAAWQVSDDENAIRNDIPGCKVLQGAPRNAIVLLR